MVAFRSCFLAGVAALAYAFPAVDCAPSPQAPTDAPPSVPIAIGGKEADISIEFIALMLPEYDGGYSLVFLSQACPGDH